MPTSRRLCLDGYAMSRKELQVLEAAREVALGTIVPLRMELDRTSEFHWPAVEALRSKGLFGVYIPSKYGGTGRGLFPCYVVLEQLARACLGVSITFGTSAMAAFSLMLGGSDRQKARWLPALASGARLGAMSITEAAAGSDISAIQTVAKPEGDSFVLNGRKIFCSTGGEAEIYIVFAKTQRDSGLGGASCFIVEKGMDGFHFGKKENKMGVRTSPTTELIFNDCRVPAQNLLGQEDFGLLIVGHAFRLSRLVVGAQSIGLAQGIYEETLNRLKTARTGRDLTIDAQYAQHAVADCYMQIEAAKALFHSVARRVCDYYDGWIRSPRDYFSRHPRSWSKEISSVKVFCSDMAMKVASDCVQLLGDEGYLEDRPFAKYLRDAKITQIYEGTNQIHRNEVARSIIRTLQGFGEERLKT